MPRIRLALLYVLIAVVASLSSPLPDHPLSILAVNQALAMEGGPDGAGFGIAKSGTVKVSIKQFLKMSRFQIKQHLKANNRSDTTVVIEGFPGWITDMLLDAAHVDRHAVKRLIRTLSGVSNLKTRRKLIKFALTKAEAKQKLLNKDVSRARQRVDVEENKIRKKNQLRKNVRIPKSLETKHLKALDKAKEAARRRHREAKKVTLFFDTWQGNPEVGK